MRTDRACPTNAETSERPHFCHEPPFALAGFRAPVRLDPCASFMSRCPSACGSQARGAPEGVEADVERLGAERVIVIAAPAEAQLADLVTSGSSTVLCCATTRS